MVLTHESTKPGAGCGGFAATSVVASSRPAAQPAALRAVLVVDDELGPREALRQILTPAYNVIVAKDGREALELFAAFRPDMVISDIRMPGMSGVELMKALRQRSPETPFVLLTGYATLESAQEAVRQGAFDYISKPYLVDDIRSLVARALSEADNKNEARRHLSRLQALNTLLEEQIRALYQKAALGELSAEMIHDLNNPMSVLCGYIAMFEDSINRKQSVDPSESREIVETMKQQLERCIALTRRFLDYARNSRQAWGKEDVNEILQDTIFVLRVRMRALHVEFETTLAPDLPAGWVQPTPLQQVFYNLATNALDALSGVDRERRLKVSSRLQPVAADVTPAGPAIEVVFSDTGPGVPAHIREKVFAPFFTTKPREKGTGLGLSICKRVIEEHGGTITLDSEPDGGARFTVRIPLRLERPPQTEAR